MISRNLIFLLFVLVSCSNQKVINENTHPLETYVIKHDVYGFSDIQSLTKITPPLPKREELIRFYRNERFIQFNSINEEIGCGNIVLLEKGKWKILKNGNYLLKFKWCEVNDCYKQQIIFERVDSIQDKKVLIPKEILLDGSDFDSSY